MLKGLKVLDLANVIAGPTSSYTLAQYGAEIIKADPPGPGHHFPLLMKMMLELTQGKRSILTDIKKAPGRDILHKLVSWADVVVHNVLDDTATKMGIRHEQLQQVNPNIISCQLSAFGGTHRSSWDTYIANDVVAQVPTGVSAHYGTLDNPQIHGQISCADTLGGLGLAFSALLGLYQKNMTGYAGECRTSLVRVINYTQLPNMIV